MIGVELLDGAGQPVAAAGMADVRLACADAGLLITSTNNTIVLMPPLILSSTEADELVERLDTALHHLPEGVVPARSEPAAPVSVSAGVSAGVE